MHLNCRPPTPTHKKFGITFVFHFSRVLQEKLTNPREIENNAYAKFRGASKVHFGRCVSDELAFWGPFLFYSGKK